MALQMYHDKGMNIQEYESYNGDNDDIEQARYSSRSNNYNISSSRNNNNNNRDTMKRTSNNINNVGRDTTNNPRQIHPLNSTKTGYHPTGAPGQPPHPNLNSHKLSTDIDTFQTSSEKLSSILKVADVQLHQHLLTIDYYKIRKYSLLLPTILMSLVISILGFVAASNLMEETTKVHDTTLQEFLIILVSSFAFLILLFVIINNQLDYSTKIAFHTSTVEDLRLLIEKIKYYKIERSLDERNKEYDDELEEMFKEEEKEVNSVVSDVLSDDDDDQLIPTGENALIPHTGQALIQLKQQKKAAKLQAKQIAHNKQKIQRHKSKLTTNLVKQKVRAARQQQDITKDTITFYGYHTELSSILSSCKNDVPSHITQFFVIMENRIELMSLSRLGVQGESGNGEEDNSRMRKNQIVRLASNEIYNEISNYILWPILTPSIDKTIETSLKNVGQLLNMNHRPSKRCKLIPCCPSITLPCFKKKTSSNIFAIINEGIDQRELDLMQIERTELMRMENDKRQRMNAGPEEIVEMKDTNVDKYGKGSGRGYRDSRGRGYGGGRSRSGRSMRGDASTFADVATEVSYDSRSYYSRGGRYSSRGGGRMGSRGGGRSRGGGMYHDDDMMTEQGDVSRYTEDRSRYTEDRSRYTEDRSRYTEDQQSRGMGGGPGGGGGGDVRGMIQGEDEYGTDGTGTDGDYTDEEDELGAKKKKKKSKKSKKKKKKKDKKKEKKVDDEEFMDEKEFIEEEYGEEDYGKEYEEEYDEVYDEEYDEENAQYVEGDFQEEVSQMEDEIYSEYSEMEE